MTEPATPRANGAGVVKLPALIVGGGPAGLTAAPGLARRGIEGLLIERRGFTARFPLGPGQWGAEPTSRAR